MSSPGKGSGAPRHFGQQEAVHVLVIDDDEVDRERVRRFCAQAGFNAVVSEEADPVRALTTLRPLAPDVIVLDYHFPRHDGLSILREIRERDPGVPVIALTGHDDTLLAVELMKAGAVDYIPKEGLTPQRLGQSIRHALRVRRADLAARAAQEALRASEEFNRRVLESSHDCITVLDLDARLLTMSPGGQRLLAVTDFSQLRGSSWIDFWKDEHRNAAAAAVAEAKTGAAGRFIGFCPSMDGMPLWWDVLVTPMLAADGEPERLLAVSRDVTGQRKQAEFEQQLLGIVSHDLRNPINAMMMAGSLLVRKLPPDSPLIATAKRVVSSGDRATRLIHDLLDFTQVRLAGRLEVDRRAGDIHVVCRQLINELAIDHPDRPIQHASEGDGSGLLDPDRIAQVVGNLARNAISYGQPGTPVTLRTQDRGSRLRIEIHNHGPAIAPDVIPTLFQPFKRGGNKPDSDRSIGLGLFIVREIVTAHGGAVDVHSTQSDGTTFSVDLPKA